MFVFAQTHGCWSLKLTLFSAQSLQPSDRLRRAARDQEVDRDAELVGVVRSLERLVQAILDGTPARAIKERIEAFEAPPERT